MYLVSVPSAASITRSAFLKLRPTFLSRVVSRHLAQVRGAEGPEEQQSHVGRNSLSVLDGPGPGEVSLEGSGVALHTVQSCVYVDVCCPVLFDEGVELDRELEQFLAQYLGPDSALHWGLFLSASRKSSWLLMVVMPGLYPVPARLACSVSGASGCYCRFLICRGPSLGVAAPAGLPVGRSAPGATRLVEDRGLAAVPALAEFLGLLPLFLGKAPVVLHALRALAPGPFVLPASQ